MNQKYFDICDQTVFNLMGTSDQGDVKTANNTLSKLLVENTDLKMYLISVGKYTEYLAWIKRFKTKYNGIEKNIEKNLELEEANLDYELGQTMAFRIDEIIKELRDDPYWYENNYLEGLPSFSNLKVFKVSIRQVIYPEVEKLSEIDIIISEASPNNDFFKKAIIDRYKKKYPDSGIPNIITEW